MSVFRAEVTKSCVLMSVSSGGLESGEKEIETLGRGLAHSSVSVEGSSVPRILDGSRELLMREGAWISE